MDKIIAKAKCSIKSKIEVLSKPKYHDKTLNRDSRLPMYQAWKAAPSLHANVFGRLQTI